MSFVERRSSAPAVVGFVSATGVPFKSARLNVTEATAEFCKLGFDLAKSSTYSFRYAELRSKSCVSVAIQTDRFAFLGSGLRRLRQFLRSMDIISSFSSIEAPAVSEDILSRYVVSATSERKATRRRFLEGLAAAFLLMKSSSVDAAGVVPPMPGFSMEDTKDAPPFQKTASGLRIQDLKPGDGPRPEQGQTVAIYYVIRRSNGYFVDASYDNSGFIKYKFKLGSGNVIKGLDEAVASMNVGGRRRVLVPPELGYIDKSVGPIPADWGNRRSLYTHSHEPLVFEVRLVQIR